MINALSLFAVAIVAGVLAVFLVSLFLSLRVEIRMRRRELASSRAFWAVRTQR